VTYSATKILLMSEKKNLKVHMKAYFFLADVEVSRFLGQYLLWF